MFIKNGVKLSKFSTQILLAIVVAERVYEKIGYEMTVTSIADGTHSAGSLHYGGNAVDLRVRHLPRPMWDDVTITLRDRLGPEYDVVLELEPPHIHVEYDPKPKVK